MRDVKDLFQSTAQSLWGTMQIHGGTVGFKVPEYQRRYDWGEENLKRLLEDSINGFHNLSQPVREESYTFLGTIILVNEQSKEPSFDGTSLSIVDGQQRITTLSLLSCALVEQILSARRRTEPPSPTREWLDQEVEFVTGTLFKCSNGLLPHYSQNVPFPRIVRAGERDNRANIPSQSEYKSEIAKFLQDFSKFYLERLPEFKHEAEDSSVLSKNYRYLKRQIEEYIYNPPSNDEKRSPGDVDCEIVRRQFFNRKGFRNLFEKLNSIPEKSSQEKAISFIVKESPLEGLVRLLLFSWYLLKCVVLTRVETDNEDYAFDIFDALNTTGEPLTAIETFKPSVIRWENEREGYRKSSFEHIEKHLYEQFPETDKRQREVKELLVSFAMYHEGKKLSLNLGSQRNYLRAGFRAASKKGEEEALRYVESMAVIAEYKRRHWGREQIINLGSSQSSSAEEIDLLRLCLMFINDMNTTLAIPILARYWSHFGKDHSREEFISATKSIAAFVAIRRSFTGGTGGIDSDFRQLMKEELCISSGRPIPDAEYLNKKLIALLNGAFSKAFQISEVNKESWITRAREVALAARASRPLCRFLLLAAADNARPDPENKGLLTREGFLHSDHWAFLNSRSWTSEKYETVEHIAPDNNVEGWDSAIYERPATRNTIGNLILLPREDNSSVGNAKWQKKKVFYSVLSAETELERHRHITRADQEGIQFSKRTINLLNSQGRLDMLDALVHVEEWTERLIQRRSQNILELAWDRISPWMYGNL